MTLDEYMNLSELADFGNESTPDAAPMDSASVSHDRRMTLDEYMNLSELADYED